MTTSDSEYQYEPLINDPEYGLWIRLLELLPGQGDSELCCVLRHASLNEPPSFEALSYTWGDPKGFRNLIPCQGDLNGLYTIKIEDTLMRIGYNLMSALRSLRHESEVRTLWVDAICINQKNDHEKSVQVQNMARIFGLAVKVLAWLGEDDEFVDLAFDTIEGLCQATKYRVWEYCAKVLKLSVNDVTADLVASVLNDSYRERHSKVDNYFFGLYPIALDTAFRLTQLPIAPTRARLGGSMLFAHFLLSWTTVSLEDIQLHKRRLALEEVFMQRAYWRRSWILQELLLAKDIVIVCHSRNFDFGILPAALLALNIRNTETMGSRWLESMNGKFVEDMSLGIGPLITTFYGRFLGLMYSLGETISSNTSRFCTDPRDNIYSLLNIAKPIDITVDYALPPTDIFIQATRAIIQQDNSLNIMLLRPQNDQDGCPIVVPSIEVATWVPPFHMRLQSLLGPYSHGLQYNSGGSIIGENTSSAFSVLNIQGYFHVTVTIAFPKFEFNADPGKSDAEIWSAVVHLNSSLGLDSNLRPYNQSKCTASLFRADCLDLGGSSTCFWVTLLMDIYPKTPYLFGVGRLCHDKRVRDECLIDLGVALKTSPPERLTRILRTNLEGKRFCVLEDGNMALVHGNAEVGDIVFVARGASAPLILRTKDTSFDHKSLEVATDVQSTFEFVGPAFVHGIMDGEMLERADHDGHIIRLV